MLILSHINRQLMKAEEGHEDSRPAQQEFLVVGQIAVYFWLMHVLYVMMSKIVKLGRPDSFNFEKSLAQHPEMDGVTFLSLPVR